jgi:two-component system chemotaxis response regulator CheB
MRVEEARTGNDMDGPQGGGGHDIVVVGASAGGVEALKALVLALPAELSAAVFVVLHIPPLGTSVLPKILQRAGHLRAVHAEDGAPIERGTITIAPPDRHIRFEDGFVRVDDGPKENGHRPAIDPLFRSAAKAYGARVTGVILSGVLDDGAAGLFAVARAGGAALVQSPGDAMYPAMPCAALELVDSAFVGTATELALEIESLAGREPPPPAPAAVPLGTLREARLELEVERGSTDAPQDGAPSGLTCPHCLGALWEIRDGAQPRYRCRTGHAFTQEALFVEQAEYVERALWAALRALEEKAAMLRRMSSRANDRGAHGTAARFGRKAETTVNEAVVLRSLLHGADAEPLGELRPAEAEAAT